MAVDASMRQLQIPPRFVPYLEKHRVYELFHNLGNELAMLQPEDPLTFIKDFLTRCESVRDKRVIILMTPPYTDRTQLAHLLSVKTGSEILTRYLVCKTKHDPFDSEDLAINSARIIADSEKEGFILADFPDTVSEAKSLISAGVLPTHAFLLLPQELESLACSLYWNEYVEEVIPEHEDIRTIDASPSILIECENSIFKLRELFKSSLKIVKIKNKGLEEIADSCARLTMKMPIRNAPKLFRVALIGPRGSRRRTLAKVLKNKFNLVHVDMNDLINAGRIMENDVGDQMRFLDANALEYPVKIVFDLLKNRLARKDCIDRGYVLTNFPTCVEDFVLLDTTDTPPNMVIFLDIEESGCKERLENRVVNMYTGSLHNKKNIANDLVLKSQSLTHPDDDPCTVAEELKFYRERSQSMMKYCGKTASIVDARGPITELLERVEAVLMGPHPDSKPRAGKLSIPRAPFKNLKSTSYSSFDSKLSYPIARTEVIPLIDSEELLHRFRDLKVSQILQTEEIQDSNGSRESQEATLSNSKSKASHVRFLEKTKEGLEDLTSVTAAETENLTLNDGVSNEVV